MVHNYYNSSEVRNVHALFTVKDNPIGFSVLNR